MTDPYVCYIWFAIHHQYTPVMLAYIPYMDPSWVWRRMPSSSFLSFGTLANVFCQRHPNLNESLNECPQPVFKGTLRGPEGHVFFECPWVTHIIGHSMVLSCCHVGEKNSIAIAWTTSLLIKNMWKTQIFGFNWRSKSTFVGFLLVCW